MNEMTPLKLNRKENLYLKDTGTNKGRGLFCLDDIVAGEELEITPAIVLNQTDNKHVEKTILNNFVFTTGRISKKLRDMLRIKTVTKTSCVVMGIASFCNHDLVPNAQVVWEEHETGLYYTLLALSDIPKGTEICTSYGDEWFDGSDQGRLIG